MCINIRYVRCLTYCTFIGLAALGNYKVCGGALNYYDMWRKSILLWYVDEYIQIDRII